MIGEIIMMYIPPIVEYLCPACGNPYFGSEIASYSVFDAIRFSDGSFTDSCGFPSKLWLTRCPKCRQFFAKKHLFRFPMTPRVEQFIRDDMHLEYMDKVPRTSVNDKKNQKLYGRYDYSPYGLEGRINFLERSIEQGLYFPLNVNDGEKEELNILLHRDLWWAYNLDIDKESNEKYDAHCNSVPNEVGWFFDAKSVPVSSNKPVKLIFNGVEYSAKLFNFDTTNRIRFMLFWDRDLRKRFEAYKNEERKATFIKKENGVYEITLSGDEI